MVRLIGRKMLVFVLLLPLLNALGWGFASVFAPRQVAQQVPTLAGEQRAASLRDYGAYLGRVARGDWGSIQSTPIERYVVPLLRRSAVLLGLGLLLTLLLGPLLGVASIDGRTGRIRPAAQSMLVIGSSLPGFFLGSLLIGGVIYLSRSGLYRGEGPLIPVQGYGLDAHLIVPLVTLAARPIFFVAYLTAGLLESELQSDYIRVARSKGLRWRQVLWRHAVPNVATPVAVALGQSMRLLVGGLILAEALFDWRGIGWLFLSIVRVDARGGSELLGLQPELLAFVLMIYAVLLLAADLLAAVVAYLASPQLSGSKVEGQRSKVNRHA